MKNKESIVIILDFDGTCVTHEYPRIGKDIGAVEVLIKLVDNGHKLILFTMRSGKTLDEAVNWFKVNNIPLYGIQTNPTQKNWTTSPKAYGNLIIDDTCLGIPLNYNSPRPFVDWEKVERMLINMNLIN